MNPSYLVRGFRASDTNDLIDIDLKCFEQAWAPEDWNARTFDAEYGISVATRFGSPIGFIVFWQVNAAVEIAKIAVKKEHRLRGVSRLLINAATAYAITKRATELSLIVPENDITIFGPRRAADHLTTWLTKLRFQARAPFVKNYFRSCGETSDGVRFTSPVSLREIDAA